MTENTPFDVKLASTGQVFHIPAGRSILDVLIEAGVDVVYDCKRGECGVCQAEILEGTAEHRDVILSDAERAAGRLIQICVSRATSPMLVLDL